MTALFVRPLAVSDGFRQSRTLKYAANNGAVGAIDLKRQQVDRMINLVSNTLDHPHLYTPLLVPIKDLVVCQIHHASSLEILSPPHRFQRQAEVGIAR
jgi:hypothetical protein